MLAECSKSYDAASKPLPSTLMLRALAHVWRALEKTGSPMALVGGMAVAHWKHVRATYDVDILMDLHGVSLESLGLTMAERGIRLASGGAGMLQLFHRPPEATVGYQIDVLPATSPLLKRTLERRVPVVGSELGLDFNVASVEDLIILKLVSPRVYDHADAAYLVRFNRDTMDVRYLLKWSASLGICERLSRIWDEAFPGESPPQNP